jgi:hypothetical protein
MQRRLAFCSVTADILRRDWEVSVDAGLDMLTSVPVVTGDLAGAYTRPLFCST